MTASPDTTDTHEDPATTSKLEAAVLRYFDAWNNNDPAGVAACFGPTGTFQDPTTGGPIGPDIVGLFVSGFYSAFPDGSLPIDHLHVVAPDRALVEFRVVGTNTGDSPTGPATNMAVDLPGVDVITWDPDTDLITSVHGHWDMNSFTTALGLQANVSPQSVPGLLDFGVGLRVHTGRTTEPGCFTVTSTDAVDGDEANWVITMSQRITEELFAVPGYLGSCFMSAGGRHYTFSAWESPEEPRGMNTPTHREARRAMLAGEHCTRIMTSFWVPERLNTTKAGPGGGQRAVPVTEPEAWL